MKSLRRALMTLVPLLMLCACGHARDGDVGIVDIGRITSHWPKFINYENQLTADTQAIASDGASNVRTQALGDLQARYSRLQREITDDVRAATDRVAKRRDLRLVVTREFVGYGGVDITDDVESELKIVETPAPSAAPAASPR